MKRIKPIISWPGGKSRLLKQLLPMIRPHTCYVEVFAGGLELLLAKEHSEVEVVNDINGELVTLYRCAQFHLEPLLKEIQWSLHSRLNLKDYLAQPGLTDIQRAARFLLRNRMSFGGSGTSYAVARLSSAMPSRENALKLITDFSERLDRVSVENLTYQRLLTLYDAPTTFFFLDPPYLNSKASNYAGWKAPEMRGFATLVNQLKADWLVTVDDSPLNRELFAAHQITPVITRNGSVNTAKAPYATFGELNIQRRASPAKPIPFPKVLATRSKAA